MNAHIINFIYIQRHKRTAFVISASFLLQVYPELNGQQYTFNEIVKKAALVSSVLAVKGVGPRDIVTVSSKIRPEFAPVFLGILFRGATLAAINPEYDDSKTTLYPFTMTNSGGIQTRSSMTDGVDGIAPLSKHRNRSSTRFKEQAEINWIIYNNTF